MENARAVGSELYYLLTRCGCSSLKNPKEYGSKIAHNPSYSTNHYELNSKLGELRTKNSSLNMLEKGCVHPKKPSKLTVVDRN